MTGFDPRLDLEISRVLRAPRASVWAAWTTPELFAQWWIPAPTRCRVDAMDVRPGGELRTSMSDG
ncbi:SRPBCC domain-containing protein, partial [Rathayibacter sp. SD072]|uniref:SRPBCC domain-containing protein n=1 Tax=Rathayibacter sp. SD072 TaxID=2781731 RepID=UPI001A9577CA